MATENREENPRHFGESRYMDRLRATIPEPRMAPYEKACAGTSVDPIDLYPWAGKVALAVFDDLGTVEVGCGQ